MIITRITDKNKKAFMPLLDGELLEKRGAFGIIEDGLPAGALVYFAEPDCCTIEWLKIHKKYRRHGFGTILVEEMKKACEALKLGNLITYYTADSGTAAFLKKMGFACAPADTCWSVPVQKLLKDPEIERYMGRKITGNLVLFSELNNAQKNGLINGMKDSEFDPVLMSEGMYDPEASFVLIKDGRVAGAVIGNMYGGSLYISMLSSFVSDNSVAQQLLSGIIALSKKMAVITINFFDTNPKILSFFRDVVTEDISEKNMDIWMAIMTV